MLPSLIRFVRPRIFVLCLPYRCVALLRLLQLKPLPHILRHLHSCTYHTTPPPRRACMFVLFKFMCLFTKSFRRKLRSERWSRMFCFEQHHGTLGSDGTAAAEWCVSGGTRRCRTCLSKHLISSCLNSSSWLVCWVDGASPLLMSAMLQAIWYDLVLQASMLLFVLIPSRFTYLIFFWEHSLSAVGV